MRFPFSKSETRKSRCINCGRGFQSPANTDEVEMCKRCKVSLATATKLEELRLFLLAASVSAGKLAIGVCVLVVVNQLLVAYLRETVLGQIFVEGFKREDGTVVTGHWRKK